MSGRSYLLDTNVIIGFLAGADWAVEFIGQALSENAELSISIVTRMELLSFPGITPDEEQRIDRFLSRLRIVGIDRAIEDQSITVRKATSLKLPDAIISGTVISIGATLVSADTDFERVDNLMYVNPLMR